MAVVKVAVQMLEVQHSGVAAALVVTVVMVVKVVLVAQVNLVMVEAAVEAVPQVSQLLVAAV